MDTLEMESLDRIKQIKSLLFIEQYVNTDMKILNVLQFKYFQVLKKVNNKL